MKLRDWFLAGETRDLDPLGFAADLAKHLGPESLPVDYFSFSVRTMHPEVLVENIVWTPETGALLASRSHDLFNSSLFLHSPVARVYSKQEGLRQNLTQPTLTHDYPVFRELQTKGFTEYIIEPLKLSRDLTSYVSWATKRPNGFSTQQSSALLSLTPFFASAVAFLSKQRAIEGLLDAYLGRQAASLVRSGQYRRCQGVPLNAIIWFSDLRGFTAFTDQHSVNETLERLNRSFEVVGSAISDHGGEILKFIGDAVLAVFPVSEVCNEKSAALLSFTAAKKVIFDLTQSPISGHEPIRVGIGLHKGTVAFGNVGTANRLDFTVIGGPVNEAARVASMCKELKEDILCTDSVAECLPSTELRSLGAHKLSGVSHPRELFASV